MRQELRKETKSPLSRLPSTASHKVLYATTENYKASVILLQGACNTSTRRLESFYKAFVIFQNEPSWLTSKYVWGFKGGHFSLSSLVFFNVTINFIFVYLHFFSYICSLMGLHLSDKQERRKLWMTK